MDYEQIVYTYKVHTCHLLKSVVVKAIPKWLSLINTVSIACIVLIRVAFVLEKACVYCTGQSCLCSREGIHSYDTTYLCPCFATLHLLTNTGLTHQGERFLVYTVKRTHVVEQRIRNRITTSI